MQSDRGAEERNDFQLRLHAVDPKKWNLIRRFATVDGEVASIHTQAERDGVKFAEFDAAARDFLKRCNDSAADQLLKRIRGGVPGERTESNQAEGAKQQKELPQNASALRRGRPARSLARLPGRMLAQGLRSPRSAEH